MITSPWPRPRTVLTAAAAVLVAVGLTGCGAGGPSSDPVGTTKTLDVDHADTDATVEVTVDSIEKAPDDALADIDLDADEAAMTPWFSRYTVELTEGDWAPDETYTFSGYTWGADTAGGGDAVPLELLMGGVDECPDFSRDSAAALAAGETVEACTIWLVDDDELTGVHMYNETWSTEQ